MRVLVLVLLGVLCCSCRVAEQAASLNELDAWRARARIVSITRDDWGIPHVRGKSDADAVFGLMYAQAEDDFNRIETNFLLSQGRLAEAEGEREVWRDLRMRLFIDPADLQAKYRSSPAWLQELMNAWADGLNFYLATHPEVRPRVLTRFEPWMALTFSEGSIGGDIERISLAELQAFYEQPARTAQLAPPDSGLAPFEPTGSNGFAIAPSNTAAKRALLWINPHTSFFFRAEAQVTSEAGLNAYGALTWGQFFVYQGFNERAGWMHTSSGVDNIDEYLESITRRDDQPFYRYGNEERAVRQRQVSIRYRTPSGMAQREFTVYRTQHGPIVRKLGAQWVSVRLMEEPVKALTQSFLRTKARNLQQFKEVLGLHTNSSNNTVFADAEGNIAYFHANFIPKRNTRIDWTKPVDGSDPATDWLGVHTLEESPNVINPRGGWLYNTNNSPWTAAGEDSPRQDAYPRYVDMNTENPRGVHAIRVLGANRSFTPQTLVAAAFDPQQPGIAVLMPALLQAYTQLAPSDPLRTKLAGPIQQLERWDSRWAVDSVANSLAMFWGDDLWQRVAGEAGKRGVTVYEYLERFTTDRERLDALSAVVDKLTADFGTWQVPWGEINRFQRVSSDIVHPFDDRAESMPVPFTSSRWGSLASFGARTYQGSKKLYGTTGNSFLAVVEFGDKVRASAITAGGQSGNPASPHFKDQAARYARGELREVYFYPEQLRGHTERSYRPGE
jgi:acyl-homoserine-lactone acylase